SREAHVGPPADAGRVSIPLVGFPRMDFGAGTDASVVRQARGAPIPSGKSPEAGPFPVDAGPVGRRSPKKRRRPAPRGRGRRLEYGYPGGRGLHHTAHAAHTTHAAVTGRSGVFLLL